MDCGPAGSSVHGILQARITGVGWRSLLQGIFSTQGWDPSLPRWQEPPGKPSSHRVCFFWLTLTQHCFKVYTRCCTEQVVHSHRGGVFLSLAHVIVEGHFSSIWLGLC